MNELLNAHACTYDSLLKTVHRYISDELSSRTKWSRYDMRFYSSEIAA